MKQRTTVEEYLLLIKRLTKLRQRCNENNAASARISKKIKSLKRRIREIEKEHKDKGLPHPEAFTKEAWLREQQFRKQLDTSSIGMNFDASIMKSTTNPDGTLFTKERLADLVSGYVKPNVNPDGTLFESPVLPGSMLDPKLHSQEKIDEFLNRSED